MKRETVTLSQSGPARDGVRFPGSSEATGWAYDPHMPANRLAGETSPYLLQHARNPVDWYPWGEEALARAREADRPIFLSIGYAACHWCHVMERESFEDEETAAFLNEHFVAIKVDREERPDLDAVYMAAVQAMTGSGGWPMSVFLTRTAGRSTAGPTSRARGATACRRSAMSWQASPRPGASGATRSSARRAP